MSTKKGFQSLMLQFLHSASVWMLCFSICPFMTPLLKCQVSSEWSALTGLSRHRPPYFCLCSDIVFDNLGYAGGRWLFSCDITTLQKSWRFIWAHSFWKHGKCKPRFQNYMESHFLHYGTFIRMKHVNKLTVSDVSESQNKRLTSSWSWLTRLGFPNIKVQV